jgi:hypothetical protein
MEETKPLLVPTLSKAKISHKLSYPIGAEQISAAVSSAAQFADLKLHFYSGFDIGLRSGHYEFLRVEYLNNSKPAEDWPITSLYKRPPQWRWEIVVQPVPRTRRHQIRQYIIDTAFSQMELWLRERSDLTRPGSDILAFFYDEKDDNFVVRQLSRLHPQPQ